MGTPCVHEIALLDLAKVGKSRLGLWVGILGSQFLILAMYLTVRRTKKNSVVMGVSLVV